MRRFLVVLSLLFMLASSAILGSYGYGKYLIKQKQYNHAYQVLERISFFPKAEELLFLNEMEKCEEGLFKQAKYYYENEDFYNSLSLLFKIYDYKSGSPRYDNYLKSVFLDYLKSSPWVYEGKNPINEDNVCFDYYEINRQGIISIHKFDPEKSWHGATFGSHTHRSLNVSFSKTQNNIFATINYTFDDTLIDVHRDEMYEISNISQDSFVCNGYKVIAYKYTEDEIAAQEKNWDAIVKEHKQKKASSLLSNFIMIIIIAVIFSPVATIYVIIFRR